MNAEGPKPRHYLPPDTAEVIEHGEDVADAPRNDDELVADSSSHGASPDLQPEEPSGETSGSTT